MLLWIGVTVKARQASKIVARITKVYNSNRISNISHNRRGTLASTEATPRTSASTVATSVTSEATEVQQ